MASELNSNIHFQKGSDTFLSESFLENLLMFRPVILSYRIYLSTLLAERKVAKALAAYSLVWNKNVGEATLIWLTVRHEGGRGPVTNGISSRWNGVLHGQV